MTVPYVDELARLLIRYSTAVKPGNLVSLVSPPVAEPLVVALYREVLRAGGHPMTRMTPPACAELLEVCEVETVDVAIYIVAPENTHVRASTELAKSPDSRLRCASAAPRNVNDRRHNEARRRLIHRFLQRSAEHALRWVAVQYPCLESARHAQLVIRAGMLDRDDPAASWRSQSERQQRLVDFLHGVQELRIETPAGTRLRLGVAGRTWINCDGHTNFPDGEVFTAPLEDATEGTVCFDLPVVHGQRKMEEVRLTFRGGRVVAASAARGEAYLLDLLNQDDGARVLGEVALGCNFALTRPTGNVLLDEKLGGTFHLALGAAYPESGGCNASAVHWDLVGDLRRGGWVKADGQVLSAAGRFMRPDWPCREG